MKKNIKHILRLNNTKLDYLINTLNEWWFRTEKYSTVKMKNLIKYLLKKLNIFLRNLHISVYP